MNPQMVFCVSAWRVLEITCILIFLTKHQRELGI